MQDVIDFSNAKIYYPEEPKNISASVEHISLTAEQARAQGWHFRYKSGKRVRITRFVGTDADVLRSTPKPEEQSTEMYRRFLLKNHHHAVKAAEALSEQWSEYRDFLARFYEMNSL
jgi:hypothetical protein